MNKKQVKIKEIENIKGVLRELLEERVKRNGFRMSKLISGGGFFSGYVYDNRIARSFEQISELNKQGFTVDENLGLFIFNAIIN